MPRVEHYDRNGNLIDVEDVPDPPRVANQRTIEQRARAALTANATYLAIASPTNAQNLAQIRLLTRECSALIRLALDELDTSDGT